METKNKIIIMADRGSRKDPSGPLFRFIRDYTNVVKGFEIHSTNQTGRSILSTGLYHENEVIRPDREWEEVEFAEAVKLVAMVARGECVAAIFFSDPKHSPVDSVEYRTVKRVCIESKVRWLSSLENAEDWAISEGERRSSAVVPDSRNVFSLNWRSGEKNVKNGVHSQLPIGKRTLALIAHDKKKKEMVDFVKQHCADKLTNFDRILATGTTGWLLKLLYAGEAQYNEFKADMDKKLASDGKPGSERLMEVIRELLKVLEVQTIPNASLDSLLGDLKNALKISANQTFADKVMPLASGPKGGDVLIADEVLKHECHAIIFFYDPDTAHPHEPDIELLERTCRLGGVYAVCVSDLRSANLWAQGIRNELQESSLASRLRSRWRHKGLREAIVVKVDNDEPSPELGKALARACAGYLHLRILYLLEKQNIVRIGVAWGYVMHQVIEQLEGLKESGYLERPPCPASIICSPLVGTLLTEEYEANEIAQRLASFYQENFESIEGKFEGIPSRGLHRGTLDSLSPEMQRIIRTLKEETDVIVTSGAPWREDATLLKYTALKREAFPPFEETIGEMNAVFLKRDGSKATYDYEVVGLGYDGFKRAAERGVTVLVCGAKDRRELVRAALTGELVSVLITTNETADELWRDEPATADNK